MLKVRIDDIIINNITFIICKGFSQTADTQWTPMMERALNVVFFISEHPQKFGGKVLMEIMKLLQKVMNGNHLFFEKI